jgi:TnpA family transposase
MLALHLLQICLVYIDTLMIQCSDRVQLDATHAAK